jgi:hypothetical protein
MRALRRLRSMRHRTRQRFCQTRTQSTFVCNAAGRARVGSRFAARVHVETEEHPCIGRPEHRPAHDPALIEHPVALLGLRRTLRRYESVS